jgi:DNA polymerase-1
MIEPITLDFETEAIVGNPIVNPPRPVGLAVWVPGQEPAYLGFGHPSGNNCTWEECREYLRKIVRWHGNTPLLFHHAGFDVTVAAEYFLDGVDNWPWNDWERVHDTMYLLFLADPYSSTLSLKPSADRYLGMEPSEQDALHSWILANIPEATPKTAGAFISKAPAELVGPYAIGDVVRTRRLFDLLHARIVADGMEAAYDRERRLFPHLHRATRRGIRIDTDTLSHHVTAYEACLAVSTDRLEQALSVSSGTLDDTGVFADALEQKGFVTEWVLTKTGKKSKAKGNLQINNPEVKILHEYRSALKTCLQTFMRPWLAMSEKDGRVHPNWNQVKQYREGGKLTDNKGTQTGRLSSDSPNFQNVPTEFVYSDGTPLLVPEGLHPLPLMRRYCLPDNGHVWIKRDFSSQEIRILAHFEDGSLCEAYRANPGLDPHQMAKDIIFAMIQVSYARKSIKITGFSIIYGSGVTGLSHQLGQPYDEAARIKSAYLTAMPGIQELMDDVQGRARAGLPIRTWGGRLYYTEPPKIIEGRLRSFEYKLLNYLIQGSAADQTKEACIDWEENKLPGSIFLATVHDEINGSAPREAAIEHMAKLKECMERGRFDVPFLSEGFIGDNWGDIIGEEEYVQQTNQR